jgi:protein phosphatase
MPPVVAVADGVAGGPAGDIASMIVIQAVREALQTLVDESGALESAMSLAGAALFGAAVIDESLRGMASTLDMAVLGEPARRTTVSGAHVGDGAVWLLAGENPPRQLTKTHRAPNGALTHAVRARMRTNGDTWQAVVRTGDRLVLATDGFHGQLPPEIAHRQLDDTRHMPAADAACALVRAALGGGGDDNISVVVADLLGVGELPPPGTRQTERRHRRQLERGPLPDGPIGPFDSPNVMRY